MAENPGLLGEGMRYLTEYHYNYSLNVPSREEVVRRLELKTHGLASLSGNSPGGSLQHWFSAAGILRPSDVIMFADDRKPYETNSPGVKQLPFEGGSNTCGWEWPLEEVTPRHGGRGVIAAADGHVESIRPVEATKPERYDARYGE